jgi:branched-subunit amino acid aminotransferase/4-amino-4-deoxychorismate lyase
MMGLEGSITEATDSNFFIISNGEVLMAPSNKVLPGISRKVVLDLCAKLKIPLHEKI